MKHTISARWLANQIRGLSHFLHTVVARARMSIFFNIYQGEGSYAH